MNKRQLLKLTNEKGWVYISRCQNLSESFIREFQNKVDWFFISKYQKLSESFIREFQDKVDWDWVSKYQKLSEDFIGEFWDEVNWECISLSQKLSYSFRKEFNILLPKNSWLYTSKKEKLDYIKSNTNYEVVGNDYIIAYKSVREDYYSVYNFQYKYEIGKTYTSHCNCNLDCYNSFGLSAWTKKGALDYYNRGRLLKVKIPIEKIGAVIRDDNKIRCFELEVIGESNEQKE